MKNTATAGSETELPLIGLSLGETNRFREVLQKLHYEVTNRLVIPIGFRGEFGSRLVWEERENPLGNKVELGVDYPDGTIIYSFKVFRRKDKPEALYSVQERPIEGLEDKSKFREELSKLLDDVEHNRVVPIGFCGEHGFKEVFEEQNNPLGDKAEPGVKYHDGTVVWTFKTTFPK
jgi:hypothetical protein